jgi:integrase
MAADDGLIQGNPAGSLVTPKEARTFEKRSMTKEEIHLALSVLDVRERVVFLFAVLVGMRPGEIFALRWVRVGPDMVNIMEKGLPQAAERSQDTARQASGGGPTRFGR